MNLQRFLQISLVALFIAALTSPAFATIHRYELRDHLNGNLAPPTYGLRLDGLNGTVADDFTFTFDHPDGGVFLEYDTVAQTINISGRIYGGKTVGDDYTDIFGFWDFNFTYAENVDATGGHNDLDAEVTAESRNPNLNSGTITAVDFGGVAFQNNGGAGNLIEVGTAIDLVDEEGNHGFSFRFNPDGHRGVSGFNGYGWLNHSNGGSGFPDNHLYAGDFLFSASQVPPPNIQVPEPTTLMIWSGVGLLVGFRRRRS